MSIDKRIINVHQHENTITKYKFGVRQCMSCT